MKRNLIIAAAVLVAIALASYFAETFAAKLIVMLALAAAAVVALLLQKRQCKKSLESQATYFDLKTNLLKTSLDPHFLFNAINSVSYSIHKDDTNTASENLGTLSKLMRTSLENIGNFGHELSTEVSFIKNYLALEKFRFKEQFDFTFKMMPYVNDMAKVPSFSIFCLIENALKKGVLSRQEPGHIALTIDEDKNNNTLVVTVTDDGLFRNPKTDADQPHNVKVLNELITRLNAINDQKIAISYSAKDRVDGEPRGCVAEMRIPLDFSYLLKSSVD